MERVKVVCIKNISGNLSRGESLTPKLIVGCVYNCDTYVGYKRSSYSRIYTQDDTWYLFPAEWFVSIEEYRELKIDKIIGNKLNVL